MSRERRTGTHTYKQGVEKAIRDPEKERGSQVHAGEKKKVDIDNKKSVNLWMSQRS